MYSAYVYFAFEADADMQRLARLIEAFYLEQLVMDSPTVVASGDEIEVSFLHVQFVFVKNTLRSVAEASAQLATRFPIAKARGLAEAVCRVEMRSSNDKDLLYFNDYLYLLNIFDQLGLVWVHDPDTDRLL